MAIKLYYYYYYYTVSLHMRVLPSVTRRDPSQWQYGLCRRFEDAGFVCMMLFCPCVIAGQTAEAIDGSCCFCKFLYLTPCFVKVVNVIRGKTRHQ